MAVQRASRENAVLDFWISLSPHVRIVVVALAALGIFTLVHIS